MSTMSTEFPAGFISTADAEPFQVELLRIANHLARVVEGPNVTVTLGLTTMRLNRLSQVPGLNTEFALNIHVPVEVRTFTAGIVRLPLMVTVDPRSLRFPSVTVRLE